jgi:hypothetical protein
MPAKTLPGFAPRPRKPRRVLMHVIDAGQGELTRSGLPLDRVRFGCRKCNSAEESPT